MFQSDMQGIADEVAPPTVIDAPMIYQTGTTLTSTLGNWYGSPNSRTYQWKIDGTNVGTNAATYTRIAGDVGKTATCVMTATNVVRDERPGDVQRHRRHIASGPSNAMRIMSSEARSLAPSC